MHALSNLIKSNIIREFDKRLKSEFSTDLYSFITTVKSDDGDSFHDNVDFIFERDGPRGLREFLESLIELLQDFHEENSKNRN